MRTYWKEQERKTIRELGRGSQRVHHVEGSHIQNGYVQIGLAKKDSVELYIDRDKIIEGVKEARN